MCSIGLLSKMARLIQVNEMSLHREVFNELLEKWALYFLCPITPMSKKNKYIRVCPDYVTKCVEAKVLV